MPKFQPPTKEQANDYARSIGYKSFDYNIWHDYYELRNWKPSGSRVQMTKWKTAVRTWYYRTDEYKVIKRQPKPKKPEPVKPKVNLASPEDRERLHQLFNTTVKGLGVVYENGESPQERKVRNLKELQGK